jgi:hypothetical protein
MAEYVRFVKGTAEQYEALQEKDSEAIYFISDEATETNKIYVGEDCYTIKIVTDIASADVNDDTVLSSLATKTAISTKANKTLLENYTVTTLPAVVELENNTEYRYNNLTGATTVNVSISDFSSDYLFYSSSFNPSKGITAAPKTPQPICAPTVGVIVVSSMRFALETLDLNSSHITLASSTRPV